MNEPRLRREPPPFREVEVLAVHRPTARLASVTVGGPALEGLDPGLPAASVRFLLPHGGELTIPTWNGNEFLLPDGTRPWIRTLTPRRLDPDRLELHVEVVLHGEAPLSSWAAEVEPGARVALSGTGRGYEIDTGAPAFLLAGDETAVPAISTLLPALPAGAATTVLIEVGDEAGRRDDLPAGDGTTVEWLVNPPGAAPGSAMVAAVRDAPLPPGGRVWVAGEAAAVQQIRRHLFEDRDLPRGQATVRGYWKQGRAGT